MRLEPFAGDLRGQQAAPWLAWARGVKSSEAATRIPSSRLRGDSTVDPGVLLKGDELEQTHVETQNVGNVIPPIYPNPLLIVKLSTWQQAAAAGAAPRRCGRRPYPELPGSFHLLD